MGNNYYSGEVDEAIKSIKTGKISQAKAVCEYGTLCGTLERKCNKKRENVSEKNPGPNPVLGEEAGKDLVHWKLSMQKQGLSVVRDILIQKAQDIHR